MKPNINLFLIASAHLRTRKRYEIVPYSGVYMTLYSNQSGWRTVLIFLPYSNDFHDGIVQTEGQSDITSCRIYFELVSCKRGLKTATNSTSGIRRGLTPGCHHKRILPYYSMVFVLFYLRLFIDGRCSNLLKISFIIIHLTVQLKFKTIIQTIKNN